MGCGDNILDGWANLDLLGLPGVIPWDLTRRLPVAESSIDFIYSEHFIEHVSHADGQRLLADCFRVLRPGGVLRLSTPDLRKLVSEYLADRTGEWADVGWEPASPCQLVNEGVREWGHLFIYDFEELCENLTRLGFSSVSRVAWRDSTHDALRDLECRPYHAEVIVEARK